MCCLSWSEGFATSGRRGTTTRMTWIWTTKLRRNGPLEKTKTPILWDGSREEALLIRISC